MTETPKTKAKKEVEPTDYVVLEQIEVPTSATAKGTRKAWIEVGETDTAKAKSSLEKKIIASVVGDRAGTFKAVAKRAWKGGVKRAQQTIWQDETLP